MNTIKINRMKLEDLNKFVALWNQDYELLTSSKFKMTLEKALSGFNAKLFDYIGIYKEKNLIGFMLLKKEPDEIWLKHILIDEKEKNKGQGSKLLEEAIKESKLFNKNLLTEVLLTNDIAKNFFLKNRFLIQKIDTDAEQYLLEYKTIDI